MKSITARKAGAGWWLRDIEPARMKTMSRVGGVLWATVLGLISLSGCRQSGSPTTPATILPLPPPEADGSYHLTTEQLFAPYKVDGKSADKFLRGKKVVVEGRVIADYSDVELDKDQVAAGGPTNPDLFLYANHPSNGFWVSSDGVVCYFPESDRPLLRKFVKKIRRQDRVFVRGTVGKKFGHIFVDDYALLRSSRPPTTRRPPNRSSPLPNYRSDRNRKNSPRKEEESISSDDKRAFLVCRVTMHGYPPLNGGILVHLSWHEAVVKKDRLIIRWSTKEKLLRTLIFVPSFVLAAATVFRLIQTSIGGEMRQEATFFGTIVAVVLFCYGGYTIWLSHRWVLDKQRNALLLGGWQKRAELDELVRFVGKRVKRGSNIVFEMRAERKDSTWEELGVMNQENTDRLGRALAQFAHLPYCPR
ncbi:MAG: hypothetical protein H8F28_18930 [Fibrella sp.]|nr:hypothetical protein [Armatimonadota bacterium]